MRLFSAADEQGHWSASARHRTACPAPRLCRGHAHPAVWPGSPESDFTRNQRRANQHAPPCSDVPAGGMSGWRESRCCDDRVAEEGAVVDRYARPSTAVREPCSRFHSTASRTRWIARPLSRSRNLQFPTTNYQLPSDPTPNVADSKSSGIHSSHRGARGGAESALRGTSRMRSRTAETRRRGAVLVVSTTHRGSEALRTRRRPGWRAQRATRGLRVSASPR